MSCCQCKGIEIYFNRKSVARDLKRYRNNGPDKTTRILVDALKAEGVKGLALLDIGGGVGVIQHELLKAGAGEAISVEAAKAYIEVAKEEADRQGHGNRVSHYHGDFVDLASDVPQADIVTLDRVICCYHDMHTLVERSSALAGRFYGLVYPRDTLWVKIRNAVSNLVYWIRRSPFRLFVHPTDEVDEVVRSNGLEQRFYRKTGSWQVVVYVRAEI